MKREGGGGRWTNWAGSVACEPALAAMPDIAGIAGILSDARDKGMTVRPRGTGHSFVPLCATDGLMVGADNMQGIVRIDRRFGQATILAGTVIADLGEPLNSAGLALANQGDIDVQTIAGAIGTGTHGTGLRFGNLSTQLASMRMVTASGGILEVSRATDPRVFDAAGVSLGSLGIIVDVTLNLVRSYRLREENFLLEAEECCSALPRIQAGWRNVELFWLPEFDQCVVKWLTPTARALTPDDEMDPPLAAPGTVERYLRPARIHWSHRIYQSKRTVRFNEMEFAVPLARGPDCFRSIRDLVRLEFPEVRWAVEYRTVAADSFHLSQAHGADVACISVHEHADAHYEPFFRAAQEIFLSPGGRPHWGKTHYCDASMLAPLYPRWDDFLSVRRELDPHGLFLNPYLRLLFGIDD